MRRRVLARRIARTVCADPAAAVHNAELGWSHGRPASRPAGFAPLTWQFDENALVGRIENEMLGSRPRTRGARTIRRLTKEAAAAALMQSRL